MLLIRIKVVQASHVLLAVAIVLFVVVLLLAGMDFMRGQSQPASGVQPGSAKVVTHEAAAVFAAAPSVPREIVFDAPDENEHTDEIADGFDIVILPRVSPAPSGERAALQATASPERTPDPTPAQDKKRVLIYHTHTHEAYQQVNGDRYQETDRWRTADPAYSIVRVGDELAALLEGFGLDVVHDVTDHEPPRLGTAYVRSLETLKDYKAGAFDLYIDLHRDAYDEAIIAARAVSAGGIEAAQLMCLIGNGEGFDEKPDTARNLAFATALTERINALSPGLCRPVLVKTGRYNQHIGTPAILVEVGHNENTLAEALASMPYLARALFETL